MTTFRVSERGATVFDSEGRVVSVLAPGTVVIDGKVESGGSLAQQYQRLHGKRISAYEDKRLSPSEDKSRE